LAALRRYGLQDTPENRRMGRTRARIAILVALCGSCVALSISLARAGTTSELTFTEYTILSSNFEMARRLLSPLTASQLPQLLARSGSRLREQPVDLAQESFVLYVPSGPPPRGYALIVFIPPWSAAKVPDGWAPVLDQYGAIFVSAAQSGNATTALGRREPLALLAEQNVVKRYPVDPQRVIIAGFSGGSRIALRLALGYADVFHGAILNASTDTIGDAAMSLPPRDIFLQFQNSTHLVYVTGDRDIVNHSFDAASRTSLRDRCVFNVDDQAEHAIGHEVMTPAALAKALDALAAPEQPDPEKLAACRAGIESDLHAKLQQVDQLIASGQRDAARTLLNDVDARYGGLAAPDSLRLQNELAPK
jgi:pimeloyl-ACP methyl ester carboxylesterase